MERQRPEPGEPRGLSQEGGRLACRSWGDFKGLLTECAMLTSDFEKAHSCNWAERWREGEDALREWQSGQDRHSARIDGPAQPEVLGRQKQQNLEWDLMCRGPRHIGK